MATGRVIGVAGISALALVLAGCAGGGNQAGAGSASSAAGGAAKSAPHDPSPASAETSGPSRSAAAPAEQPADASLPAAEKLVRSKGYTPNSDTSWPRPKDLNVIVALKSDAQTSSSQMAFFFHDGRFLGTDTATPSANMSKKAQDSTTITLSYQLYQANDPNAENTGGAADVRYHWTGSKLEPLDPIPTDDPSADHSRR
ncbi:LppP/LprE family lipoprotein [Amycolatopsis rubida]|uniref:LppP/LprE lipoprotein n=1 Tax=Amycolatopsis rubida TaxID=112413 RepID=A0A1I5VEM3_9PSEU|nr:LppP/LprE family lipoprotein [Amycolatopsis rubida]SFQ05832.1 LppP/LprE lipoprotein [Amycolatopsis rubida]